MAQHRILLAAAVSSGRPFPCQPVEGRDPVMSYQQGKFCYILHSAAHVLARELPVSVLLSQLDYACLKLPSPNLAILSF